MSTAVKTKMGPHIGHTHQQEKTPANKLPIQRISLIAGPLIALIMMLLPTPESLSFAAWATAAMGVWMAIWWATEAVPVPVTALLPLVMFAPLGILSIKEASAPYANPTIYLFMGGFIMAAALQKSGLHKRIAFVILSYANSGAKSLIWSFMSVSALLSMWMTNTSTTMMLLPIALSIITTLDNEESEMTEQDRKNFKLAILLGVAYAATIGGMATLVGTPPNAFLAGFMNETYGLQIGFAQWMMVGLPLAIVMLPIAFWLLTSVVFPVKFRTPEHAKQRLKQQQKDLGTMTSAEKRVGVIFLLLALAWMTRPFVTSWLGLSGVSDAGLAMLAAGAVFVIPAGNKPSDPLMKWEDMRDIPWGVLLLFGGGLSLALAVSSTGLATWLGQSLVQLNSLGLVLLVISATTMVIFLTEMTSNLATAATFLPVVAAIALQIGGAPISLTVPIALAASCAFMLPVATPPNAIVFSSGFISIQQMMKAGFLLNLVGIVLVSIISVFLAPLVFAS